MRLLWYIIQFTVGRYAKKSTSDDFCFYIILQFGWIFND